MYVPAKKVVIHHTATSNTYTDGAAEVRAIYAYHTEALGWGDIGYNALVDKYGNIYEGRHGRGEGDGREILSADVVAGHTLSHNYGSLGIAAIGNYQKAQPSPEMKTAIDDLTTFECARHFIDPNGVGDFLRSDDVWHDGMNNISGHDESNSTLCPGRNLTSYLPTLRDRVDLAPGLEFRHTLGNEYLRSRSGRWAECDLHQIGRGGSAFPRRLVQGPGEEPITYLSGYALAEQYADPVPRCRSGTRRSVAAQWRSNLFAARPLHPARSI